MYSLSLSLMKTWEGQACLRMVKGNISPSHNWKPSGQMENFRWEEYQITLTQRSRKKCSAQKPTNDFVSFLQSITLHKCPVKPEWKLLWLKALWTSRIGFCQDSEDKIYFFSSKLQQHFSVHKETLDSMKNANVFQNPDCENFFRINLCNVF